MALDRIEVIENRLSVLEHQLELFSYRLRSIEQWRVGKPYDVPPPQANPMPQPQPMQQAAPPPIIQPGARREDQRPPVTVPPAWSAPPRQDAPPQMAKPDTEYMIGAKVLPKIGAVLVLLGLLSLVAWGYSSGWITPPMIFVGEILFCLAFIALGQKKRGEAEQFGQILTGIGSCGLYLTLAGGHLVQHLYTGEALVAAAMAVSFANLLYGNWSDSRSFLGIGILGGLATALLPMKESNTMVASMLHLGIVAPAALIAGKKRWWDMAAWLWLGATCALGPLLVSEAEWTLRLAILYTSSLASVGAYAYGIRRNAFDPSGLVGSAMLVFTAALSLGVMHQPLGALALLALGAGAYVVSFLASDSRVRLGLVVAAIGIPLAIAPVCFPAATCTAVFGGFAILAALYAIGSKNVIAAGFAVLELALALGAYLVVGDHPVKAGVETMLLVELMVAAVAAALAATRTGAHRQVSSFVTMAVLLPLFSRLAVVVLAGSSIAPRPEVAVAQALALFTFAAMAFAARSGWIASLVAVWLSLGLALLGYVVAAALGMPGGHDVVLLAMILSAAVGALPLGSRFWKGDDQSVVGGATGFIVGLLTIRLGFVVATLVLPAFSPFLVMSLVASGYSTAASIVALARRSNAALAVAWMIFAIGGSFYLAGGLQKVPLGSEMAMMSGLFAAFACAGVATARLAKQHREVWHAIALLGWVVFSRWVDVSLSWSSAAPHGISTLTIAWITYALGLLTLGIWLHIKDLRYWSFAVMFISILKILAIDMASTHIMFRVAVLVGLGLLMLAGGYWYIKGKGSPAAT